MKIKLLTKTQFANSKNWELSQVMERARSFNISHQQALNEIIENAYRMYVDENTCSDCGEENPGRYQGINCPNCGG